MLLNSEVGTLLSLVTGAYAVVRGVAVFLPGKSLLLSLNLKGAIDHLMISVQPFLEALTARAGWIEIDFPLRAV
jgi:uncharacterized membrane protein